jgi:preprotein translocase subunit SecY
LALYGALYFIFVFFFTYFYTAVPLTRTRSQRTCRRTAHLSLVYAQASRPLSILAKIITRITFVGALFLGVIAVLADHHAVDHRHHTLALGGTALLIVVSLFSTSRAALTRRSQYASINKNISRRKILLGEFCTSLRASSCAPL